MSAPVPLPPPAPTRRLAIFPLPLVLFPNARLPLHIFEPRYRPMVADCLDGDHEFGIVCHDGAGPAADIVQGKTGTIAHIDRVTGLPDGRSHVVVHLERLRQVKHLLTAVIAAIEARASTRERAHANGHGPMARG